jgi:hypothetical protein
MINRYGAVRKNYIKGSRKGAVEVDENLRENTNPVRLWIGCFENLGKYE